VGWFDEKYVRKSGPITVFLPTADGLKFVTGQMHGVNSVAEVIRATIEGCEHVLALHRAGRIRD
jgi:hypothetical protein